MSSVPRRPRRAVRPPGTVGTDESVLISTHPAAPPPAPPTPPAATGAVPVRPDEQADAGDLWRSTRSLDDSDRGWGRDETSPDDDRLRREKPPHW